MYMDGAPRLWRSRAVTVPCDRPWACCKVEVFPASLALASLRFRNLKNYTSYQNPEAILSTLYIAILGNLNKFLNSKTTWAAMSPAWVPGPSSLAPGCPAR